MKNEKSHNLARNRKQRFHSLQTKKTGRPTLLYVYYLYNYTSLYIVVNKNSNKLKTESIFLTAKTFLFHSPDKQIPCNKAYAVQLLIT